MIWWLIGAFWMTGLVCFVAGWWIRGEVEAINRRSRPAELDFTPRRLGA